MVSIENVVVLEYSALGTSFSTRETLLESWRGVLKIVGASGESSSVTISQSSVLNSSRRLLFRRLASVGSAADLDGLMIPGS